jgi:hypothetical protein
VSPIRHASSAPPHQESNCKSCVYGVYMVSRPGDRTRDTLIKWLHRVVLSSTRSKRREAQQVAPSTPCLDQRSTLSSIQIFPDADSISRKAPRLETSNSVERPGPILELGKL